MRFEGEEVDPIVYMEEVMGIVEDDAQDKPRYTSKKLKAKRTEVKTAEKSGTSCWVKIMFLFLLACFVLTSLLLVVDYPNGKQAREIQRLVKNHNLDDLKTTGISVLYTLKQSTESGCVELMSLTQTILTSGLHWANQLYLNNLHLYEENKPVLAQFYQDALSFIIQLKDHIMTVCSLVYSWLTEMAKELVPILTVFTDKASLYLSNWMSTIPISWKNTEDAKYYTKENTNDIKYHTKENTKDIKSRRINTPITLIKLENKRLDSAHGLQEDKKTIEDLEQKKRKKSAEFFADDLNKINKDQFGKDTFNHEERKDKVQSKAQVPLKSSNYKQTSDSRRK